MQRIDFEHIAELNRNLGIDVDQQLARKLVMFPEAKDCVDAGIDYYKRPALLSAKANSAWQSMVQAAAKDDVNLYICSAFRNYLYQVNLINRKLERGKQIDEIIKVLAPPGFSEHHTGCAIDIISDEMQELDESFEKTRAFAWLMSNAVNHNFFLSYPRDNPYGVIYEPWHWCYR